MERKELIIKYCPFCGGDVHYRHIESLAGSYVEIRCTHCGIVIKDKNGGEGEIEYVGDSKDIGETVKTIVRAIKAIWRE